MMHYKSKVVFGLVLLDTATATYVALRTFQSFLGVASETRIVGASRVCDLIFTELLVLSTAYTSCAEVGNDYDFHSPHAE